MAGNASVAQYGTPTVTCLECMPPPATTRHPDTGFSLGLEVAVAAALIVAGTLTRWRDR